MYRTANTESATDTYLGSVINKVIDMKNLQQKKPNASLPHTSACFPNNANKISIIHADKRICKKKHKYKK